MGPTFIPVDGEHISQVLYDRKKLKVNITRCRLAFDFYGIIDRRSKSYSTILRTLRRMGIHGTMSMIPQHLREFWWSHNQNKIWSVITRLHSTHWRVRFEGRWHLLFDATCNTILIFKTLEKIFAFTMVGNDLFSFNSSPIFAASHGYFKSSLPSCVSHSL